MTNGGASVTCVGVENKNQPCVPHDMNKPGSLGLTKREYAAIQIMAGFAANPSPDTCISLERHAEWAVKGADALFAELAK